MATGTIKAGRPWERTSTQLVGRPALGIDTGKLTLPSTTHGKSTTVLEKVARRVGQAVSAGSIQWNRQKTALAEPAAVNTTNELLSETVSANRG
jgi:hypothetical protein